MKAIGPHDLGMKYQLSRPELFERHGREKYRKKLRAQRSSLTNRHRLGNGADIRDRTDFTLAAAPLILMAAAYPAIATAFPGLAETLILGVTSLLIPLVLLKLKQITWPVVWLIIFAAIYGLSAASANSSRGFRHTIILVCLGSIFLAFASYGASMLSHRWVCIAFSFVLVLNVLAIAIGENSKNTTGGGLIYVVAFAFVIMMRNSASPGWRFAFIFMGTGLMLSYFLSFRFLAACSVVFLIAFWCATRCRKRFYWLVGIIGPAFIISTVIWFILNSIRGGIAWELSQEISNLTGHRANSGREIIWLRILDAVEENPIFGLGAGVLPRDVFSTGLSSHNYYIQVYLQVGLIGLAALVCFLLAIWHVFAYATSLPGRFGSAVFIMFVVHNATEVLLLQNSAFVSVPAWCAIGLAFSLEREKSGESARLDHRPKRQVATMGLSEGTYGCPGKTRSRTSVQE